MGVTWDIVILVDPENLDSDRKFNTGLNTMTSGSQGTIKIPDRINIHSTMNCLKI